MARGKTSSHAKPLSAKKINSDEKEWIKEFLNFVVQVEF